MSIIRWMDKEDVAHIYNGILLSHKKEWNNATYSNMDVTRDYHTKWSKSERERQIPHGITCMWNLKYGTNESMYKTETDSQTQRRELWLSRGRGWEREGLEFGISRCKLLYTGWINKVLLYSTGNYIQYPVISHNGKECKKKNVCTCITESLSCTAEIGTTL